MRYTNSPSLLRQTWRHTLQTTVALATGLMLATSAMAETFPSKLVTVVVPYPAGGASDYVARLVQPDYQKQLGQNVIIENVAGATGSLGVQKVLSSPADGHFQVMATPMELVLAPLSLAAVKFKPEDVRLASLLTSTSVVLMVPTNSPAKNLDEFVALAKTKELTVANTGIGSLYHLVAEKFAQQAGIKFVHVPYKGGAQIITDLGGGSIDAAFFPLAGPTPGMLKEGKARAIGIAAPKPHALFPNIPPISSHKSLPGFNYDIWLGVQVPKATPDAVIDRINTAMNVVLQNPEIRKSLEGTGGTIAAPMNRGELDKLYTSEIERYKAMAKGLNLTPQ